MKFAINLLSMGLIQYIFALFGCKDGAPKPPEIHEIHSGPFTIKVEISYYQASNYDQAKSWIGKTANYFIIHDGKEVDFPEPLELSNGKPFLWQVFLLPGSPKPALIGGDKPIYLIVEENGKLKFNPLDTETNNFAIIQFLDQEKDQPGKRIRNAMSDRAEDPYTLQGGNYLMINDKVVLHIPDLKITSFNRNLVDFDQYYSKNELGAISFSPDRKSIAFLVSKNSDDDPPVTDFAIQVIEYEKNSGYLLHFDKNNTHFKNESWFDKEWFDHYFTWIKDNSGSDRLQTRIINSIIPWQGKFNIRNNRIDAFVLEPVKAESQKIVTEFIMQSRRLPHTAFKEELLYSDEYATSVTIDSTQFFIWYSRIEKQLKFYIQSEADEHASRIINDLGNQFNQSLKQGYYQELFTQF